MMSMCCDTGDDDALMCQRVIDYQCI